MALPFLILSTAARQPVLAGRPSGYRTGGAHRAVSAGLASSYTFVNPVIAMLLGVSVAGETVTSFEWGAVSVVLLGVLLLLWRRAR